MRCDEERSTDVFTFVKFLTEIRNIVFTYATKSTDTKRTDKRFLFSKVGSLIENLGR